MRFKGVRKYNSSTAMLSRPCMYAWTYSCFIAAMLFIFLAGSRQAPSYGGHANKMARVLVPLTTDVCDGRRVFMYDLPRKYNEFLRDTSRCNHTLIPWLDLCPRFRNGGFGGALNRSVWGIETPAADHGESEFDDSEWYETDFYMLEVVFHSRMKTYRCLTADSTKADAFYIPHYTGLLALDYLYKDSSGGRPYEERKLFGKDLIEWLDVNGGAEWRRYAGKDHFLAMGRTTWDFRIGDVWSVGFSELPHVVNMTSLMIESLPGVRGEQAIPYPTVFHPSSPERLRKWVDTVKKAHRKYLFTYVGAPRAESWSIRGILTASCDAAGKRVCNSVDCSVISCSHNPVPAYEAFLHSTFCLQPRGDTPTRRSTFDCLISGAIPVFFHKDSAETQYTWHLPRDPQSYSVYIDEEDLKAGVSIEQVLRSYSQETIEAMQRTVVSIIPNLMFFDCRKDGCSSMAKMDAFDLTIQGLLQKIGAMKHRFNVSGAFE